MSFNALKRLAPGLLAALVMVTGAVAGLPSSPLSNFGNGSSRNLFDGHWYFYNDNDEVSNIADQVDSYGNRLRGNTKILTPMGTDRHPFEFNSNSVQYHDRHVAVLGFEVGRAFLMGWGAAIEEASCQPVMGIGGCYVFPQYAGITTTLRRDDTPIGEKFENVTSISFWARASQEMNISVLSNLSTISDNDNYREIITVTPTWQEFTIILDQSSNNFNLSQEGWGASVPFDATKITQFQWQWQANNNQNCAWSGNRFEFYLADVVVHGYEHIPFAKVCEDCVSDVFELEEPKISLFGLSDIDLWSAYDDRDEDGSSEITWFGFMDTNNGGSAAAIDFTRGSTFYNFDGNETFPYVGIRKDFDEPFNAAGITGIYFEYKDFDYRVTGIEFLTLKIYESENIAAGYDAVFHIKLPVIGGEWKSALVPFNMLEDKLHRGLDISRIARIEFEYSEEVSTSGTIAIGNVYWYKPIVTQVLVKPSNFISMPIGGKTQFSAVVSGERGTPIQAVTWSVDGALESLTVIDTAGMLTVAQNETADILTVRATSVANDEIWGEATVNLYSPYIYINTAQELFKFADTVNSGSLSTIGKVFVLTDNIDISGFEWTSINMFQGTFEGGNHTIAGLSAPLFRYIVEACTVRNLGLVDVNINMPLVSNIGALADSVVGGTIHNCYVTGTINGLDNVGGLVGTVAWGSISNSYAAGTVSGRFNVGGLVGRVWGGNISNNYATNAVSGENNVGGLVGGNSGYITNSAALNPSISAKASIDHLNIGRVVGTTDQSDTLSNNIAFIFMTPILVNTKDAVSWENKGGSNRDGADITKAAISADGTFGSRFTIFQGWAIENGKLPGFGTAVDMPLHLLDDMNILSDKITISLEWESTVYNGNEQIPGIVLSFNDGSGALLLNTDYEVEIISVDGFHYDTTTSAGTNVGKVTIRIAGIGSYSGETTREYRIEKANPLYTVPVLTAVYGDNLSSVILPAGWIWSNTTGTVGNVGARNHNAIFVPADTGNYNVISGVVLTITVAKADPVYTVPANLTAVYGDNLASVTLPARWTWEGTGTVGNAGTRNHNATFTPADTGNYNVISGISLTITVAKANPVYTVPTNLTAVYGDSLSSVTLPARWAWEGTGTVGNAGTRNHNAIFTPADTGNYVIVTFAVRIEVSKAPGTFVALGVIPVVAPNNSQRLSIVQLPAGYAWVNPDTTLRAHPNQPQIQRFAAMFTDLSGNYETVRDTITLNVMRVNGNFGEVAPISVTYTHDLRLSGIALPQGYTWMIPSTAVNAGDNQTFAAMRGDSAVGEVRVNVAKGVGATVAAPTLNSKTATSITINAVTPPATGQTVEYARSTTSTAPQTGWQTGLMFSGLTENTLYYIFARSAANNNYNAGAASVALAEVAVSILSQDRFIPDVAPDVGAIIAPVTVLAGEFTAGPNPVDKHSGNVVFYWTGRTLSGGTLFVYDASGNVVNQVVVDGNDGRITIRPYNKNRDASPVNRF